MINRVILEATLKYIKHSRRFWKDLKGFHENFQFLHNDLQYLTTVHNLHHVHTQHVLLCILHNFINYVNAKHVLVNTGSSKNKIRHVTFLLVSVLHLCWWNVSILSSIEKKMSALMYQSKRTVTLNMVELDSLMCSPTWWSDYCDLNEEEYNLNQSKDGSFVKRMIKNNSWNNGDCPKIHEIFLINCFVFVIILVWQTVHSSAMTQITTKGMLRQGLKFKKLNNFSNFKSVVLTL